MPFLKSLEGHFFCGENGCGINYFNREESDRYWQCSSCVEGEEERDHPGSRPPKPGPPSPKLFCGKEKCGDSYGGCMYADVWIDSRYQCSACKEEEAKNPQVASKEEEQAKKKERRPHVVCKEEEQAKKEEEQENHPDSEPGFFQAKFVAIRHALFGPEKNSGHT